jgi:hypothetical protein
MAAQKNHVAALELLIKAKADVNKATQVRELLHFTFFLFQHHYQEY